jgi:hypothetical protein
MSDIIDDDALVNAGKLSADYWDKDHKSGFLGAGRTSGVF